MPGERRIVYVLGAGASLGAGAYVSKQGGGRVPILTQATFWDTFLRFCRTKSNRKTIEGFLFRYFLDYKKVPGRTNETARRQLLVKVDVEEVFTFLSERNYAPSVSPQLKTYTSQVWSALLEEVGHVFGRFSANKQTKKVYHTFRRRHLRKRDTVVSFNYDVIFEQSLPTTVRWYYEGVHNDHAPQALRILKPHGSINWEEIDGTVVAGNVRREFPTHPVVVAPTHLKFVGTGSRQDGGAPIFGYLNQSPQIAEVWTAMEREMREAKAWVFIGYSFPSSDLYFSSVLRSTLAARDSNPDIILVNPDAMGISRRIGNRFYVPQSNIRTFPDLVTFNQLDRGGMLSLFD